MAEKIAVIGAGSWGTANARLFALKGYRVGLWAREPEVVESIRNNGRNLYYLTDVDLPRPAVEPTDDMAEALRDAGIVILAAPSHVLREVVAAARDSLRPDQAIVSLAKGVEQESLKRMTEVLADELPRILHSRLAVLSGPNHAEEVSKGIPSATVVAAFDPAVGKRLQQAFMTPYFRVYTNPDVMGVELGGATKNVIAIAAGVSDGLGYGDNTKASLITRGLAEMTRLGVRLGAQPLTFAGLSGIGDLIATCTSKHSRNRGVGEQLASGMTIDQIAATTKMVAEGVRTAPAVRALAEQHGVEVPITVQVTEVLAGLKEAREAVASLMSRGATDEAEEIAVLTTSADGADSAAARAIGRT